MKKILLLVALYCPLLVAAQSNFKPARAVINSSTISRADIHPMKNVKMRVPRATDVLRALPDISYNTATKLNLKNTYELIKGTEGELIALAGKPQLKAGSFTEKCQEYLVETSKYWGIKDPVNELKAVSTDEDGDEKHITYEQLYHGIKVWNAELKIHAKNDEIYYSNGRLNTLPDLDVVPSLTAAQCMDAMANDVQKTIAIKVLTPEEMTLTGAHPKEELIVYQSPELGSTPRLAYHLTIFPNVTDRWEYFVDAKTGVILYKYRNTCKIHSNHTCLGHEEHDIKNEVVETKPITENAFMDGPETGTGLDLLNINRTIKSYRVGNSNYLIDATKPMFKAAASSMPNNPVGAIWTLNAFNTSPQGKNFKYDNTTSSNANWNNPTAVSAHYNANLAFDYFSSTFGRNSIDGKGGTMISLINVADEDGGGMDNAFWNGEAMFYGNGATGFRPLARGLDVAGHEMTHGVVQSTANLEYQGESGALNESFADIFGAMIDRNDWQMGEDVVKISAFPSGALRDLSNPHNGGTNLNSPGYQPQHYSERYTGTQDNGGVHINSGITNFAFFKFASAGAVGKSLAEQAFYRALTKYLVKSSRFVDLRAAVIQSIKDLNYGTAVENAAAAAFDAVGIPGAGGSGGSGTNGNYQNDLPINPGNDIIVLNDANITKIYVTNPAGSPITVLSNTAPISNVSASDDGSELIFVGKDKKIYYLFIDWSLGTVDQQVLQDQPIWRNAVISKDGFRVAALLDQIDNKVDIYDFDQELWKTYTLVNPTTGQGVTTDEVEYAGSLEWDYSGKYVIYDASNKLKGGIFGSLNYWDVGILKAYDPKTLKFGDGQIIKLFSDLPEGISIGNPTFAKNSPYIIGFDLLDENTNKWSIYGVNSQTGVNNTIASGNTVAGFPSYSRDDKKVIFNSKSVSNTNVIKLATIKTNKIESDGTPASVFFNNATNGVWLANGTRNITKNEDLDQYSFSVSPNPVSERITVDLSNIGNSASTITIVDFSGKDIEKQTIEAGNTRITIEVGHLPSGIYALKVNQKNGVFQSKFIKQ